jgi:hypothetical protein
MWARCHCYDPVTRINHPSRFTLTAVNYRRRPGPKSGRDLLNLMVESAANVSAR